MTLSPLLSSLPTTAVVPAPPPSSSHVAVIVCSTLAGLIGLASLVGLALWYFGPPPQPPHPSHGHHSFARLDTHDTSWPSLRPGGGRRSRQPGLEGPVVHVDVDVETASSYLDSRSGHEKTAPALTRKWSAGSFYRRWAVGGEAEKESSQWWNPSAEEEERERLARATSAGKNLTRKPSRISRLQSLRWPSTAANRMSDIEEASNERSSAGGGSLGSAVGRTARLSVAVPESDAPTFDDDDGLEGPIPTILSPSIPVGPNAVPRRLYADVQDDPSPPQSITPSFRSYIEAIQRSLSSASFGARSFATIPEADPPPERIPYPTTTSSPEGTLLVPQRPTNPRPVSSSTFGPILQTSLPRFSPAEHSHPCSHRLHATPPPATMRLPPVDVSPAQSFGSSFARYVGAIQRSLSRSSSTAFGPPSRASTRRTNVSRAPTHRTFGSSSRSRTDSLEEEEEASLVPPLPTSSTFQTGVGRGGMLRDWDDDETTMESYDGATTVESDLGEVADVVQTGMVARAVEIGVGGGEDGSRESGEQGVKTGSSGGWTVRPGGARPLPVPIGASPGSVVGGRERDEPWVKVVRKLPVVPVATGTG